MLINQLTKILLDPILKWRSSYTSFMTEINECTSGTHDCHLMAVCNNTEGSYNCSCKEGYNGDGRNCTGKFRIY